MDFDALLTLSENGKVFANPRRVALLKAIQQTGSISQGAKQAGISYKAAYDAIKDMNNRSESPLIASEKGGKGGGGASLTHFGERIVQMYELLDTIQNMGLKALNDEDAPLHSLLGVMAKFSLQTSARNQFFGTISNIENHTLHDRVFIELQGGQHVIATITHGSTLRLQLAVGKDVVALVKGPAIQICTIPPADPSIDNQLQGKIQDIQYDESSAEVSLKLDERDEICALINKQESESENLGQGKSALACFSSSQVIIATLS
ncbi:TOBE domain-containing protein [Photobacterium sp. SDRW27]|uniref:TOBE domain-containing protein n=1 Tax=Photobacterium obscurum TaxID=2829490 RepID=UPI002243B7CA|nr:TOBE domain-containing protein [Photobacterium obscurum]MCW8328664.1 TOBE domain-containing protein [Photobacterium obscurum]